MNGEAFALSTSFFIFSRRNGWRTAWLRVHPRPPVNHCTKGTLLTSGLLYFKSTFFFCPISDLENSSKGTIHGRDRPSGGVCTYGHMCKTICRTQGLDTIPHFCYLNKKKRQPRVSFSCTASPEGIVLRDGKKPVLFGCSRADCLQRSIPQFIVSHRFVVGF